MSYSVQQVHDNFAIASPVIASSPGHSSSPGLRRLTDSDVRAIFEALHHEKPAPSHLPFQIVRVGPTGLKLSPPSYEFEDGLYVLLRPAKANKKKNNKQNDNVQIPQPPPHLKHLLMEDDLPETCPWSLSGPQFPTPTAMQQRYCYPKGRPEYSSLKGGALWTMYGADGKEDVEYRLLHVYYSAKRAHNSGLGEVPSGSPQQGFSAMGTPTRKRSPRQQSSTPRRALPKPKVAPFPLFRDDDDYELCHSPAITSSSVTSSSLCGSPFTFEAVPNIPFPEAQANGSSQSNGIPDYGTRALSWPEQLIVSPINEIAEDGHSGRSLLQHGFHSEDNSTMDQARLRPSIFRDRIPAQLSTIHLKRASPLPLTSWDDMSLSNSDPFDLDFPLQHEIDAFWNDPVTSIMMNSSRDCGDDNDDDYHKSSSRTRETHDDNKYYTASTEAGEEQQLRTISPSTAHNMNMFAQRLESVQEMIRERILSAPIGEQSQLVNIMTTWSRNMALDPLAVSTGTSTITTSTVTAPGTPEERK